MIRQVYNTIMAKVFLIFFNLLMFCFYIYFPLTGEQIDLGEDSLSSNFALLSSSMFLVFGLILAMILKKKLMHWTKIILLVVLLAPFVFILCFGVSNIPAYLAHSLEYYKSHPGFPGTENYILTITKSVVAAILVPILFTSIFWIPWSLNFLSLGGFISKKR